MDKCPWCAIPWLHEADHSECLEKERAEAIAGLPMHPSCLAKDEEIMWLRAKLTAMRNVIDTARMLGNALPDDEERRSCDLWHALDCFDAAYPDEK